MKLKLLGNSRNGITWKRYLKELGDNEEISVNLLIGPNCLEALEPVEVIPRQNDGPYAIRTALGLYVVAPVKPQCHNVVSCNRIAVVKTDSGKMAEHHFEIEKGCADISVKEMLKKMYMTDFNEPCLKDADPVTKRLKEISYEDKRFLKIMQNEILKVGKYNKLPLPLRNNNMSVPNNRNMLEKRLMHLKNRFQKDCKFYEDYNKFMEEIRSKGYARKAKTNSPDGRTWHLPHHGVYHPFKPSKLKVVFDCSAKLNGRSINKELLPGPDLTNMLVGFLTEFKENKVAFIAHIEKMYFQIFFAEQHRSLLQFLWWKEGNISEKPTDYEMCVHVFGGVSSGGCSKYALKITAVENKEKFGKETAETLQNNCYVDDLLKSVANQDNSVNKKGYRNVP